MAIIPMLYVGTSAVVPMEGPYVSGIINTLRAIGTLLGSALIGQMMHDRGQFHTTVLNERLGQWMGQGLAPSTHALQSLGHEAGILATIDINLVAVITCLALIPIALFLHHVPSPTAIKHANTN